MERQGRRRSEEARRAVLQAMRDLVVEQGYARVTIEGIAERARVGKPTIYRWWQSKNAILAECVLSGEVLPTPVEAGSVAEGRVDAVEWLQAVLEYIDQNAPLLRGLIAAAYEDEAMSRQLEETLAEPIEAAVREWAGSAEPQNGALSARGLSQLLLGAVMVRLSRPVPSGDAQADELFEFLVSRLSA